MRTWFRLMTQLLLVMTGLLVTVAGFNDPEVTVGAGLLMGGLLICGAALWHTVSRNSAVPDIIDGPVKLASGNIEDGQTVPAPRSKMFAMTIGAAGFAVGSAWMAMSAWPDEDWFLVLVGIAGVALFGIGAIVRMRHWKVEEWIAFSRTGITVHNHAGHLTYPWHSITELGIAEVHHRGGSTRMFAANPDPSQALGERGRISELLSGLDFDGWTLTVSTSVYDLDADELVELARTWQQSATHDR